MKPGGGEKLPKFHAFVQEQNLRGLCPSVSKPKYKFVFSPKKEFWNLFHIFTAQFIAHFNTSTYT